MANVRDVVERSVWTLLQAAGGVSAVASLNLPGWAAVPVAGALAVIKNLLVKVVPVVEAVSAVVAKEAPVVAQVAEQVHEVAVQADQAMHAGI